MTWPSYSSACIKDVAALLRKGGSLSAYRASDKFPKWIGPAEGSQAYALEKEIEKKFKVKHAVAVNSGTAALHAGLAALGVRGKEVVTSPYTFSATASAILLAGGIPRFADINPYTYCITKESVKRVVTKRTGAILPVHLFGYFGELQPLCDLGIPVLEDACQAVGARRGEVQSGTIGIAGAYSFNGSKNIPTGESGALVTNDDKIAEKARLLINHGENFDSQEVGYNYRMQEVVACIARHGLRELDKRNRRRRELANILLEARYLHMNLDRTYWGDTGGAAGNEHVFYVTPFKVASDRRRFVKHMSRRGIPVQAGYTTPLHHLPAFRKYATKPLPVVDEVHKRLCLITTLTPGAPISYAHRVARAIQESLDA